MMRQPPGMWLPLRALPLLTLLALMGAAAAVPSPAAPSPGAAAPSNAAPSNAAPSPAPAASPARRPAAAAAFYGGTFARMPSAAQLSALGRALFFETALSASARLACASCHDPAHAFGPPDGRAVVQGGRSGRESGLRAVPSLMYGASVPQFSEHFVDDDGDDSIDQGPTGGRTWDGRAATTHEQARLPLFSDFEMANASAEALAARLRGAPIAGPLRAAFGAATFDDPARLVQAVELALETFQEEPAVFAPYRSKYDAWLRHEVRLSAAEERGLAIFNDPSRGNCARCHPSAMQHGAFPQFTDHGFAALGVPRNAAVPANADPRHVDLGLCGPLRADLAGVRRYCGLFRTPTLRNVAVRNVFFHNGRFHRLDEVLRFYAARDTQPARWYPTGADGIVRVYDDLPAMYRGNLDRAPPFGGRAGDKGAFGESEVRDLLAFLATLTDENFTRALKNPPNPPN